MKKLISLFLVFSILTLSIPLTAKERKGADLIIQKKDGTGVRGELIAVKQSSLLLIERETGADVTVDIGDVMAIRIVRKSKVYKALLGGVIGLSIGTGVGNKIMENSGGIMGGFDEAMFALGAYTILGIIIGLIAGKNKTIHFTGKSDSEIQEILEKLRKKARVKNSQ